MVIVMSVIAKLTTESETTNRVAMKKFSNSSILHSIEIGSGKRYLSETNEYGNRRIEVWLHLHRPITKDECTEFETIIEYNSLGDESNEPYGQYGTYDYHLPYFPKAWMEDILPRLEKTI